MALHPYPGLRAAMSCIGVAGAVFTAAMMIYAAQGITGASLFALWAIAPYAVFIITARVAVEGRGDLQSPTKQTCGFPSRTL